MKGKTEQAVVYDPIRDELFTATRGNGAQLNGYRIRVGKAMDLSGTILATGFPFKQKHHIESLSEDVPEHVHRVCRHPPRRLGCAGSGINWPPAASTASGRSAQALGQSQPVSCWPREAGAIVTDLVGGHNYENSRQHSGGLTRVLKEMFRQDPRRAAEIPGQVSSRFAPRMPAAGPTGIFAGCVKWMIRQPGHDALR